MSVWRIILVLGVSILWLTGCATATRVTDYRLDSNPPGAKIYRGNSPDTLRYYKTTPYHDATTRSKSWSNNYFQARLKGYYDSEVIHQPLFRMGQPTHIQFNLRPKGGKQELASYRQRDTLKAYYEFLDKYPNSILKEKVFVRMSELIAETNNPHVAYDKLTSRYPESVSHVPEDKQLRYLGPKGLKVHNLKKLLDDGIGSEILVEKVMSNEAVYQDFSIGEVKQLKKIGLTDELVAAMIRSTNQHAAYKSTNGSSQQTNVATSDNSGIDSLAIQDNSGEYMCPWTSDGVLADWVDKAINASTGASVGSAAGAYAGRKALENVPFLGSFLGSKVGEATGRKVALEAAGGHDYIRETSDLSFNSLETMARYIHAKYAGTSHFQEAVKAANEIYPGLQKAVMRSASY